MDIVLLLARLLLASIFVWSAVAKLLDRPGSRRAMRDFGVPRWLVPLAAAAIPAAELITAGLLVPATTAWAGALTGLLLLLGFTAAVGYHLLRGHTPRCHCFGQAAAEPISTTTVLRNALLVALAAGIVLSGRDDPGVSVTGWLATTPPLHRGYLLLGCLAVTLLGYGCALLTRIRRDQVVSPRRPDRELADLLAADRPALLVFTDPGCGACVALRPELEDWHRRYGDRLAVAVVTDDPAYRLADLPVLRQRDRELADAYGVHGTPCAVVVGPEGDLRDGPAYGAERIRHLVDTIVDRVEPGERRELPVVPPTPR